MLEEVPGTPMPLPLPPERAQSRPWLPLKLRAASRLAPWTVVLVAACFDPYFQAHDLARDQDQDGVAENADCDDDDPFVTFTEYYVDGDLDGYGVPGSPVTGCARPEGYAENADDCADDDPNLWFESWWYEDLDLDGYGVGEAIWRCAGYGTSLVDGDCNDSDASVFPGAEPVCDELPYDECVGIEDCDSKDQDCDGMSDCEAPTGDGGARPWAGEYDGIEQVELGASVSAAGDVDGDGASDLLLGAPGVLNDDGETTGGAALLTAPPPATWDYGDEEDGVTFLVGRWSGGRAGEAVASAGDTNGDGFADLLIAAPGASGSTGTGLPGHAVAPPPGPGAGVPVGAALPGGGGVGGGEGAGYVALVLGPLVQERITLGSHVSVATLRGEVEGDRAGEAIVGLGDTDEDHFDDLLVGAPRADNESARGAGAIYLIRGPLEDDEDLDQVADATLVGVSDGDRLGQALAALGDLDLDGRADFGIGAPTDIWMPSSAGSTSLTGTGAVYLFTSPPDGENEAAAVAEITLTGDEDTAFGASLAAGSDLDGDGQVDLVIGEPLGEEGGSAAGAAHVLSGAGILADSGDIADITAVKVASVIGDAADLELGTSLATPGDMDGDGSGDLVLGLPTHEDDRGALLVFYGPLSGNLTPSEADLFIEGASPGERLGGAVSGAGDVNGLGRPDIIVGAVREESDDGAADQGSAFLLLMDGL